MEVELDEERSLTNECDDEEFSRDLQHQEECYSLARGKEKRDQKASERYGFKDMVSFVLTASSEDPSSVQDGMPKEVKSLLSGKAWESTELPKGKNVKGCRWVYKKKESSEKAIWLTGLIGRHGVMSKSSRILKFKRRLDLRDICGV